MEEEYVKGERLLFDRYLPVLSRIADDPIISPPGQLQGLTAQSDPQLTHWGGELPKSHP